MLFIITGLFLLLCIFALIVYYDEIELFAFCLCGFLISLIITLCVLTAYISTKNNADAKIAVLEEQNAVILEQVEPLVEKYLNYESGTFKELKQNPQMLVSLSMFPELKGDEFVKSQMLIITENQKKITELKLKKAGLDSFKVWLFMGNQKD